MSEPQVAQLVEKTGEAIIKESDAQEKAAIAAKAASEELAELKSQMVSTKMRLRHCKLLKCNSKKTHVALLKRNLAEKEMANAVMLSKMLNKRDVFDTNLGQRMKAVTTVDQFLSNFSSNIYTEMEQQLIIAPMFNRHDSRCP